MALFRKRVDSRNASVGPIENLVGSGSIVRGKLVCVGAVRVDGAVEGDLECGDGVIVGERGIVRGDVTARVVMVAGRIGGSVIARSKVELLAGGQVNGDIRTPRLVMADGIAFDGRVEGGLERARVGRNG